MPLNFSIPPDLLENLGEAVNTEFLPEVASSLQKRGPGIKVPPPGDTGIQRSLEKELKGESLRSTLAQGAALIPGAGQAAAAINAIGSTVDNLAKDEFGIYKSTGAAVADRLLDPIGNFQDLFTGELFGGQQRRKERKETFLAQQENQKLAQTKVAGNIIKNSTPDYKAPRYGERGLKFDRAKSKFAL